MNKDKVIGFGVGALVVVLLGAASWTMAAGSGFANWQKAMGGQGRATQVINEGNFDKFTQMHQMMADGKYEDAAKVKTELGLGGGRRGGGCGMRATGENSGGCPMANGQGGAKHTGFVDKNSNGICDTAENLK